MTNAECTQANSPTIIRANAALPYAGLSFLRKYQFAPVPSSKEKINPSKGPRNAPSACGVRSRKCPNDNAYCSGFFLSRSDSSTPGAGVFAAEKSSIPTTNPASPTANKTSDDVLPDLRSALSGEDLRSRASQPPTSNANPGIAGIV